MSTPFYDLASLVVVPSGYKASKVYAQKPLTTDGQLSFSRASTATRVNSAGLIETVSSNVPRLDYTNSTCPKLLLEPSRTNVVNYSSAFDQWSTNASATVNANATTGPDGTLSADRLNMAAAGSSGIYAIVNTTSGVTYTQSIYVKGDSNATNVRIGSDAFPSTAFIDYNAVTGAILQAGGAIISSSVTNAANGFKRLTWTFVSTGTISSFVIYNNTANAGSLFLYGAQQEAGAYPTSLIQTTTAAVTRLADACSKNPANGFFGTNTGTIFVEFDSIGFNPTQGNYVFDFAAGADTTNRILVYFSPSDNTLRLFYATTAGVTAQQSFVVTMSAIKKIAVKWDASSIKMFYNGTATNSFAFGASAPNDLTLFARYTDTEHLAAKAKQLITFQTALTDAQCIELTTL